MIHMTHDQLYQFTIKNIEDDLMDGDMSIINDSDDLSDYITCKYIQGKQLLDDDYIYWLIDSLTPLIVDDIIDYIDDASYDVHAEDMRTYYSMIAL